MFAPLAMACSSSSKIKAPAPSPITKPSRSLSKGLEAPSGSSFLLDKACAELKPPTDDSVMAASEPPATMIVALPRRIVSKALMIAVFDDAQAETVA
ncbi:hypothetical protein D3C86_1639950 [compost metagenome]